MTRRRMDLRKAGEHDRANEGIANLRVRLLRAVRVNLLTNMLPSREQCGELIFGN